MTTRRVLGGIAAVVAITAIAFVARQAPRPGIHAAVAPAPVEPAPPVNHAAKPNSAHPAAHPAVAAAPSLPAAEPRSPSRFPDTPAGRALDEHFRVASRIGDRKQVTRDYAESIAKLRPHAREAVHLLYDAYHQLQDDPLEQFATVRTLADLDSPEAFEPLDDIAREPIPNVEELDHHRPQLTQERMLRAEAIGGLGRLAASGLESARQSLYEIATDPANQPHRSLQFQAVNAFVGSGAGSETRAEAVKRYLPADLHWVFERRARLGKAIQPG